MFITKVEWIIRCLYTTLTQLQYNHTHIHTTHICVYTYILIIHICLCVYVYIHLRFGLFQKSLVFYNVSFILRFYIFYWIQTIHYWNHNSFFQCLEIYVKLKSSVIVDLKFRYWKLKYVISHEFPLTLYACNIKLEINWYFEIYSFH